jgi:hypothetical protein
MLDELPKELVLKITEDMDLLSLIQLKATCWTLRDTVSLDDKVKDSFWSFYKTPSHQTFAYSTSDIIEDILGGTNLESDALQLYMTSVFVDYKLTIVTYNNDYTFTITFGTSMLDGSLTPEGNVKLFISSEIPFKVPLFLLFLGVQILLKLKGSRSGDKVAFETNFDTSVFPRWYEKALFSYNYSGTLFSELFSSSALISG